MWPKCPQQTTLEHFDRLLQVLPPPALENACIKWNAPIHSADKCFLQENRESRRSRGPVVHVLQLCSSAFHVASYASYGSRNLRSRLEY